MKHLQCNNMYSRSMVFWCIDSEIRENKLSESSCWAAETEEYASVCVDGSSHR